MSRIGKQKLKIPKEAEVIKEGRIIIVKGPKGELEQKIKPGVEVEVSGKTISVKLKKKNRASRALWGLYRSLIKNMVFGVTKGWNKGLELVGVGFRVNLQGRKLILSVGFSHPVEFELPEGVEVEVKGTRINISGVDKQLVGEVAARIRKIRPPEPYKGKGIRYIGEVVRKKPGKAAKAMGAGAGG